MFAWFEWWFPKRYWVCNDNGLYVTRAWRAPPKCTYISYITGGCETEQAAVELYEAMLPFVESRKVKHD